MQVRIASVLQARITNFPNRPKDVATRPERSDKTRLKRPMQASSPRAYSHSGRSTKGWRKGAASHQSIQNRLLACPHKVPGRGRSRYEQGECLCPCSEPEGNETGYIYAGAGAIALPSRPPQKAMAQALALKASAYIRICFTMETSPLLRVGERCSFSPMRSMK